MRDPGMTGIQGLLLFHTKIIYIGEVLRLTGTVCF